MLFMLPPPWPCTLGTSQKDTLLSSSSSSFGRHLPASPLPLHLYLPSCCFLTSWLRASAFNCLPGGRRQRQCRLHAHRTCKRFTAAAGAYFLSTRHTIQRGWRQQLPAGRTTKRARPACHSKAVLGIGRSKRREKNRACAAATCLLLLPSSPMLYY